ncbi:hypothetical protein BDF22DRAFT_693554 [Syncephalis plumigaleata]|nr:hypothetical protein BDF22DRAFT_693554 [Syncephalis plumigaleata]
MLTRSFAFGLRQQASGVIRHCLGQQIRFASRRASKVKANQQRNLPETPKEAPISPFISSLLASTNANKTTPINASLEQNSATPLLIQHHVTLEEYQLATSDLPTSITESPTTWAGEKEHVKQQAEQVRRIIGLDTANSKEIVRWNVQKAVDEFGRAEADTGSPEVQAAVWTVRIRNLERHLTDHRKDVHNRRNYRQLIHKRAKMLRYLKRESLERYHLCLKSLSLLPEQVEGELVVR